MDTTPAPRWLRVLRVAGLVGLLGAIVVVRAWAHVNTAQVADPVTLVYGVVAPAAYLVPGVVLLRRRRWHIVGWLLCLAAVGMAFTFGGDWGTTRFGGPWTVWLLDLSEGSLFWLPFVVLLVMFPDGLAARTRRQRLVGRTVVAAAAAAVIPEMLFSEVVVEGGQLVPSPLGIAFVPRTAEDVTIVVEFAALVVAFTGLVRRYRSSAADARRQYRWVLSAIVFLVVALLIGIAGSELAGNDNGPWWVPIMVAYLFLPASFMVAILRYRLYEIDRLISRTVTYSVVVATLGAIYLIAVALLTRVLPLNSDVAVAASTLAAAAVMRPLLHRVQYRVDRHFNRPRFDAMHEVQLFTRGLRDQTDLGVVEYELRAVVERTLRPATLTVWIQRR